MTPIVVLLFVLLCSCASGQKATIIETNTLPAEVTNSVLVIGESTDAIKFVDNHANITIDGKTASLPILKSDGGFAIYKPVKLSRRDPVLKAYQFKSDHSSGYIWTSYYGDKIESRFQIKGKLSASLPNQLTSYKGNYFSSRVNSSTKDSYTLTPIIIEVDYDAATLRGFDIRELRILEMEGKLDGNRISGTIYGPDGTMEYEGGVFGPNGAEVSAVFQNGDITGFVLTHYDEERTDLIN